MYLKERIKACSCSLIFLILFVSCNKSKETSKPTPLKIVIQPIGKVKKSYIDSITHSIESFYGFQTTVNSSIPYPKHAYYAPRKRYRADSLIRHLKAICPTGYDKIIGITTKDISTTKGKYIDWGIMGLGYLSGKSCVVSSYRLKKYSNTKKEFYNHLVLTSLHEIGHTLGLNHCKNSNKCFMIDAEGGKKLIKNGRKHLCDKCLNHLNINHLR